MINTLNKKSIMKIGPRRKFLNSKHLKKIVLTTMTTSSYFEVDLKYK